MGRAPPQELPPGPRLRGSSRVRRRIAPGAHPPRRLASRPASPPADVVGPNASRRSGGWTARNASGPGLLASRQRHDQGDRPHAVRPLHPQHDRLVLAAEFERHVGVPLVPVVQGDSRRTASASRLASTFTAASGVPSRIVSPVAGNRPSTNFVCSKATDTPPVEPNVAQSDPRTAWTAWNRVAATHARLLRPVRGRRTGHAARPALPNPARTTSARSRGADDRPPRSTRSADAKPLFRCRPATRSEGERRFGRRRAVAGGRRLRTRVSGRGNPPGRMSGLPAERPVVYRDSSRLLARSRQGLPIEAGMLDVITTKCFCLRKAPLEACPSIRWLRVRVPSCSLNARAAIQRG